jgi:ankyrin repeat protein
MASLPLGERLRRTRDGSNAIPHGRALRNAHTRAAELLAIPNELFEAATAGDADWVRRVLERTGAGNARRREADSGRTALHMAMAGGHADAAREILKVAPDMFMERDEAEKTGAELAVDNGFQGLLAGLLHERVGAGDVAGVQHLVDLGVDVDRRAGKGITGLHRAARKGDAAMVAALIHKGAKIDAVDDAGRCPLHEASRSGKVAAVQELVKAGADIDARDRAARVPLHYGAATASEDIVSYLLSHGAAVTSRDSSGQKPEHVTPNTSAGVRTKKLLLRHGLDEADIDSPGRRQRQQQEQAQQRPVSPTLASHAIIENNRAPRRESVGDHMSPMQTHPSRPRDAWSNPNTPAGSCMCVFFFFFFFFFIFFFPFLFFISVDIGGGPACPGPVT